MTVYFYKSWNVLFWFKLQVFIFLFCNNFFFFFLKNWKAIELFVWECLTRYNLKATHADRSRFVKQAVNKSVWMFTECITRDLTSLVKSLLEKNAKKGRKKYTLNITRNCACEYMYIHILYVQFEARTWTRHTLLEYVRALNGVSLTRYICIFDISAVTQHMYAATIIHVAYT